MLKTQDTKGESHMVVNYNSGNGFGEVQLTFNDGPHTALTPRLLDILKQENMKAVFFVLGSNITIDKNIKIVKRAFEEGHIIGNHTYFHRNLKRLSDYEIRSEIFYTEKLIKDFLSTPTLFRPPFGAADLRVNQIIWDSGYVTLPWSVDSMDWKDSGKSWVENVTHHINAREDSIVLMHDTYEQTVEQLPELINAIKNKKMQSELVNNI